jgi:hypothetical protein
MAVFRCRKAEGLLVYYTTPQAKKTSGKCRKCREIIDRTSAVGENIRGEGVFDVFSV